MGEIFERQLPVDVLPWTGERLTSGVSGQVEIEHLQRYTFARDVCRGCDVLDIASGEGYGAALIAQVARSVVGVELDAATVLHAKSVYLRENLSFIRGDARSIPLADDSVDVVVSFETIEHFYEHETFINEVRRVLRPNGVLVLSSPERDIYSPVQGVPNPYHRRELTRDELKALLASVFCNITLYAQRAFAGAAMIAEGSMETVTKTVERRSKTQFELSNGLSRAPYWIAVASDAVWPLAKTFLYVETPDLEAFYGEMRRSLSDLDSCRRDLELTTVRGENWRQQLVTTNSSNDALLRQFDELKSQADEWRRGLIDGNTAYRDLTEKLHSLEHQAEEWRQTVLSSAVEVQALREETVAHVNRSASLVACLSSTEETAKETLRLMEERVADILQDQSVLEQARLEEARRAAERFSQLQAELATRDQAANVALHAAAAASYAASQAAEVASLDLYNRLLLELADARAQTANLEALLQRIFSSRVWRVTRPLRGLAHRYPRLIEQLRRLVNRRAELPLPTAGALVAVGDTVADQPLLPDPEISPLPTTPDMVLSHTDKIVIVHENAISQASPIDSGPPAPNKIGRAPVVWFYLGDTLEWLASHSQLTGVGRVTTELFFSAIQRPGPGVTPCIEAPNHVGLASTSVWESAAYLSTRTGAEAIRTLLQELPQSGRPPVTATTPQAGDHVLFTGVVWTEHYVDLFQRLFAANVRFSVFVYDVIPVLNPEYVDKDYTKAFVHWLITILSKAECIYVSSSYNREQILRWAMLREIAVSATLIVAEFGTNARLIDPLLAQMPMQAIRQRFVLSVGTIDRRKNQEMVCNLWPDLLKPYEPGKGPQLVLVGRYNGDTGTLKPAVQEAIAQDDILILPELADAELAWLYQNCTLTCFPSLSEGYGLPVAESLSYGKVCIASDLPVIRDHAGMLPWYVSPGDPQAMLEALQSALNDDDLRAAMEAKIRESYVVSGWTRTWDTISKSLVLYSGPGVQAATIQRPQLRGIVPIDSDLAFKLGGKWCTSHSPKVSIIIVNWNAAALTAECIRHLWRHTKDVSYEIIIVDNGSRPEDALALRQLGDGVKLIELGINRFYGEANNLAVEHSQGQFVCFLNNDVFVRPGWLIHLLKQLEREARAGAAGPLFLFPGSGVIQEAGGKLSATGYPVRGSRGESERKKYELKAEKVDYVSGATLLVVKECFDQVGGFDLMYEPAYYEDADLCFKLLLIDRPVYFCPEAEVIHVEGAAANNIEAEQRRTTMGDLNRDKFVARWSTYLETRDANVLPRLRMQIVPPGLQGSSVSVHGRTAALYTPYGLTTGGGERYLLSIAAWLSESHVTTIVTPHPYSRHRLLNLGLDLQIDLRRCKLALYEDFVTWPQTDQLVVLGNHINPPIEPLGRYNTYICQFPFPIESPPESGSRGDDANFDQIVTYSEYARAHVYAALSARQMPRWPVVVIEPPVPQYDGNPLTKGPIILSVGRFFKGAHNKRHDLLIQAFRRLLEKTGLAMEFHIVGSSIPDPYQMEYIAELKRSAEGLPVKFHVNGSAALLSKLYSSAALYWHGTGLGADLEGYPAAAEHFGITVVEAMSAGCVPLAFNAGGPREVITHGVDGYLFGDLDQLIEQSIELLQPCSINKRTNMGFAAKLRSQFYSHNIFLSKISHLIGSDLPKLNN